METIGYLGPEGTYSEKAAKNYAGSLNVILKPCPTVDSIFEAIQLGNVNKAILPLENSCEGTIVRVLDLLARHESLEIIGEVVIHVCHHLLGHPGTSLDRVQSVLSHPQALAQCSGFIAKFLPTVKLQEVESTARAASIISECGPSLVAIGNEEACTRYNLTKLASNIQDMEENYTRFIVVSKEQQEIPWPDFKENSGVSLILSIPHKPGALYEILKQFALRGINLTKIESRPARTKLGEYIFFIDLEGHIEHPEIREALERIKHLVLELRILGCYPRQKLIQS